MLEFPTEAILTLLKRVKNESPYYRNQLRFFDSGRGLSQFNYADYLALPITPAEELRNRPESFVCEASGNICRIYLSSSTTGLHKKVSLTLRDLAVYTSGLYEGLRQAGINDTRYFIPILSYSHSGATELIAAADRLHAKSLPVSINDPSSALTVLQHIGESTIFSVPTILLSLGREYRDLGLTNVKSLVVGAELITPGTRKKLAEFWGTTDISEFYGSIETAVLGFGHPDCGGVHLNCENVFVEVINPITRRPVGNGEVGEIIVTTFKEAMPLVRYQVGDLALQLSPECACGQNGERIRVLGRSDSAFIAGGALIFPIDVQAACDEYLLQQNSLIDGLIIQIERSSSETDSLAISVSTSDSAFSLVKFVEHIRVYLAMANSDFRNALSRNCVTLTAGRVNHIRKPSRKATIRVEDLRSIELSDRLRTVAFVARKNDAVDYSQPVSPPRTI